VDFRAKRQIARIVGAEGVAVHNQHLAPVEVEKLLPAAGSSRFRGQSAADEKVAVAVKK
jgi:hypothetical protein